MSAEKTRSTVTMLLAVVLSISCLTLVDGFFCSLCIGPLSCFEVAPTFHFWGRAVFVKLIQTVAKAIMTAVGTTWNSGLISIAPLIPGILRLRRFSGLSFTPRLMA